MDVTVKVLRRPKKTMHISEGTTVAVFKQTIADEFSVTVKDVSVIFKGKILKDQELFEQLGIEQGNFIVVTIKGLDAQNKEPAPEPKLPDPEQIPQPLPVPILDTPHEPEQPSEAPLPLPGAPNDNGDYLFNRMADDNWNSMQLVPTREIVMLGQQIIASITNNPQMLSQIASQVDGTSPERIHFAMHFISIVLNHIFGYPEEAEGESEPPIQEEPPNVEELLLAQYSEEERESINRIRELSNKELQTVIMVYEACDKDENLAANLILCLNDK